MDSKILTQFGVLQYHKIKYQNSLIVVNRDFTKIGRQPQRGRHIKPSKACLIQSYHVCKDTNHYTRKYM